ncbi:pirin family protein [Magnetospirillum sulfuroxidans]|uniref:Pirin family protein n=1 Tax=Magnetospirillum sulfuroxidans TaxID=611300 RepID=A0ABS5IDV4_9PROT|nr:pirin family protein [Magnetospirillum sulfuroxidans]MBR9972451.1 pirin family protein [Magnetospirillum sulfuroxidans]
MLIARPSAERGKANFGWLDSRHSFSFGEYFDPAYMGFASLRVINEDWVAPGTGFDTHPHRDMEIVTYVLEGALEHQDSLGSRSVIRPGEVQRMTAGTGIRHSEYNASDREQVHLLQIWILPDRKGLEPGYEQKPVKVAEQPGRLHVIASPDGRDGAVSIHQNAVIHAGILPVGSAVAFALAPDRGAWVQVARGAVTVNGLRLEAGDGLAARDEEVLNIHGDADAEILVFDLGL